MVEAGSSDTESVSTLSKDRYEDELKRLQIELVKLQEWVVQQGLKLVVVFEGRDAAGKGGCIKRIIAPSIPGYAG